jgi:hypothetical protein
MQVQFDTHENVWKILWQFGIVVLNLNRRHEDLIPIQNKTKRQKKT